MVSSYFFLGDFLFHSYIVVGRFAASRCAHMMDGRVFPSRAIEDKVVRTVVMLQVSAEHPATVFLLCFLSCLQALSVFCDNMYSLKLFLTL